MRPETIAGNIRSNIAKVIVGKEDVITMALVALTCEGHILLEDVPGTGKTMLAKALSKSLELDFRRVQFTPDLLPSDVTGVNVFNEAKAEFEFRPGPAFTNVLLADEINRANPRTQSALLECMEERQITVDGVTRKLTEPFLVFATQNPIEQEGTFPLPEAQRDRFLLRLDLGYPALDEELSMLQRFALTNPLDSLTSVATPEDLRALRQAALSVHVGEAVGTYLLSIVRATRSHEDLRLGASPRASLALMRAARALALIEGRSFVRPDDIKRMVKPVLAHRIIIKSQSRLRGQSIGTILEGIVQSTPVPVLDG